MTYFYDWPLRINPIKTAEDMLPYMFAAHKYNYDRYGLFYVRYMTWLPMEQLTSWNLIITLFSIWSSFLSAP